MNKIIIKEPTFFRRYWKWKVIAKTGVSLSGRARNEVEAWNMINKATKRLMN